MLMWWGGGEGFIWRFTGFYGEPKTDRKDFSWKALRMLNASRRRPWLCVGDFNEVLLGCEKEGGSQRRRAAWIIFGRRWMIVLWLI